MIHHHIIGHQMFVLVSTKLVMMCLAIYNPASCEIHVVIRFLQAKTTSAAQIHCELCT
jgi:hypothetical protein